MSKRTEGKKIRHKGSCCKSTPPNESRTEHATFPHGLRAKEQSKEDEDAALFLRAVSGVDIRTASRNRKSATASKAYLDEEKQLFLKALETIDVQTEKAVREKGPPAHRFGQGRMKQLKQGALRIQRELDLHGQTRDEAIANLERFLAGAYRNREQAVLVITGKGINSPEGPVLRGVVSDWLRKEGQGMVLEFFPAPREKGGSGAFVVFIRKA